MVTLLDDVIRGLRHCPEIGWLTPLSLFSLFSVVFVATTGHGYYLGPALLCWGLILGYAWRVGQGRPRVDFGRWV